MSDQPFMGPVAARAVQTQCTNWDVYGLEQIWQMVEREDGRISWDQVAAWNRMKSLCDYQATRLRQAAQELADLWPPDSSEAARAFQSKVFSMAKSLDDSAAAAGANANALGHLTDGIAETRRKISRLMDQLSARRAEQLARERTRLPGIPDGGLFTQQREELDHAARQIMRGSDSIPAIATTDFRVPRMFDDRQPIAMRDPLPPDPPAGESQVSFGSDVRTPTERSVDVGVPQPTIEPPSPVQPGSPSVPAGPALNMSQPRPDDVVLTGMATGPASERPHSPDAEIGAPANSFESLRDGRTASVPMPIVGPGGVINPSRAAATTGQAEGTSPGPSRVGSGPAGMIPPMMQAPRNGSTGTTGVVSPARTRRRTDDPHHPWAVPQGVPAVIEPRADPVEHDPGPGVIGIDR